MQTTYHLKPGDINDGLMRTIRELYKNEGELTITVTSTEKTMPTSAIERETLFYSLFGSWQSEETGEELVKQIYSDRISNTRQIEL